jgi:hypothetical protein
MPKMIAELILIKWAVSRMLLYDRGWSETMFVGVAGNEPLCFFQILPY